MRRKRVILMGAAGRDFHNFNVVFRNDPSYEVVAFTASQVPGIANRVYPYPLSGELYPNGIPVYDESDLPRLMKDGVDLVVLSYSDLSHEEVMRKASFALASGADFALLGPRSTSLKSRVPVIAVTAVRTGAGKSTVTRYITRLLRSAGKRFVVVRHPMPYGDLRHPVQRFADYEDLERYRCTFEEREEYEPHLKEGNVVYAGVDYVEVLREVEKFAEVIVWDGGNNDFPFFEPTLHVVVLDALRPGNEVSYYPGMVNLIMADVVVINKANVAPRENVELIMRNVKRHNTKAAVTLARAETVIEGTATLSGKRALVIEDAPTVTHGGMSHAAGYAVAVEREAVVIDPRPFAVGEIKRVYEEFSHIGPVLPSMGYTSEQIRDLRETILRCDPEVIVNSTPIDLVRLLDVKRPQVSVRYELKIYGDDVLAAALKERRFV
ncbi:MAG: cyclic 2,3-diphosphoglycerate synthase [Thaumarchaeota archaeon]|nr:cyclic 2,3-diphosphoglycerate synthase [Candidatus Calditenuaceae archaeon]MDW8186464.1 cyclic 2,3-diphosphoglycerate synthase [Nitrososphaerota archaeon]